MPRCWDTRHYLLLRRPAWPRHLLNASAYSALHLPKEKHPAISRRNVFAFSMAVAAHEVLQFVGCVTGLVRVGGAGPQAYHRCPGREDGDRWVLLRSLAARCGRIR